MLMIFDWFADLITYDLFEMSKNTHLTKAVHFFILDITKISVLLILLIYAITFVRSFIDEEKVKNLLSRKNRFIGYFGASLLGAVTPFCSCSSIPLFMTFLRSGVPFGVAMAFLIVSPIINEVAIVLLIGILGIEFTLIYLLIGLSFGVISGFIFDLIDAKRYLIELPIEHQGCCSSNSSCSEDAKAENVKLTWKDRHQLSLEESLGIFKSIWIYIFIGIIFGAAMHGYLPEDFINKYIGKGSFWSVPAAVLVGIPLYTGSTSAIPVIQSLITKGLPVGTALAFMMSAVGASLPEFMILKKVMKFKLLAIIFGVMLVLFTIAGFIFNAFDSIIR
ncbi:permease [Lentisphaerota bacterium WC36G]|nr:permease [Lentisphaerae bacterium WC36]